jgi:hypothetical protein
VKTALIALNRLVADGAIVDYAIGGAIGASFYLPAMQTEDVDVFVFLPATGSPLVSLSPVYEALKIQGGIAEREYVRFGAWPVQILTDATPLIAEAIRDALAVDFDGIPTRVFKPEHLCAVALETGRAKDYARVVLFLESEQVTRNDLKEIASRFGLSKRLERVLDTLKADDDSDAR